MRKLVFRSGRFDESLAAAVSFGSAKVALAFGCIRKMGTKLLKQQNSYELDVSETST